MVKRTFLLLSIVAAMPALGQTGPSKEPRLSDTVKGTVEIRQETQRKEDRWAEERAELEARYRAAKAGVETLEKQEAILEKKDQVLERQVNEMTRRLEESERLEQGLQEVMETILSRLGNWIEQDLPFLPEERTERIRALEEALALTDTSAGEKLRRLLEALQVECEYGDTVEVYQQKIEVEGEPIFADIFRLGRLSIFWQTPDGTRVGEYDRVADRWVELPTKYRRGIRAAIEMAAKQRPVELVKLPVGRISP